MPIVYCPYCTAAAEVDAGDLGYQVACPSCNARFVATAPTTASLRPRREEPELPRRDMEERPRRSREDRDERDDDDRYDRPRGRRERESYDREREDALDIREAKSSVYIPALIVMIFGVVWLGFHILEGVLLIADPNAVNQNPFMPMQRGQQQNKQDRQAYIVGVVVGKVIALVLNAIVVAGASAMMRLENRGLALAAMIIEIIPCCSCGFCLGMPFGIWGLVTLLDPTVIRGFEAKARLK